MSKRITVIGDGAMGTLCAIMLAENGHRVTLWSAFAENAAAVAAARENRRFLPGTPLPDNIDVSADDASALQGADLAVSAVPTEYMRPVWTRLRPHCPPGVPICSVTKGVENQTLLPPTGILCDVLDGGEPARSLAALSGPSIAPEIARKLPASVAVASADAALCEWVQHLFLRPYFRVYTNPDLVGVEIAGATKNVIAIAAGILDGLGTGVNCKAALLTRGLTEICRLGVALGGDAETFSGLAGMGDLVTTCFSPIGRNRSFGEAIGQGKTVEQARAITEGVVEGIATTVSVVQLAARHDIEMPIVQAVHDVLFDNVRPRHAIETLMTRPPKAEH